MLIQTVGLAFDIYYWLLIGRIIVSWIQVDPRNPIVEFIYRVTEPVLAPFRGLLPMGNMRIDFSPLIALLLIGIARRFVITLLAGIAF